MVRSARLGLVAIVAMVGAGACSSGSPRAQEPEVASLIPSSVAASASASAAPKPERPRQRLDDTEADYQALIKPYRACMKAHGRTNDKEQSGWAGGDGVPPAQEAAQKACQNFWPLPPWEQDPANPEAKDFARDVVKCLKGKGVKYVETTADGIGIAAGGSKNDEGSITKTGEFLDDCQREVAARK
jgi:hypothetical protein